MVDNSFFEEQKEQSLVKSIIVAKYFKAWSTVMISTQKHFKNHEQKIAYIDLFAGPGRYNDNTQSTPIKILTNAINDTELSKRLVTIFNDKNEESVKSLENVIENIPNIDKLKYKPTVYNYEVDEEIEKIFEDMNLIPTLFFVDPWGYKGLSSRLINSVLKDWGCDTIFFFNYNRINMGINNKLVEKHIVALFGKEGTKKLYKDIQNKNTVERESIIIEKLYQSIRSHGPRFVLKFRFVNNQGKRTSHYLIFVSKHFLGYEIMKEIMARESTRNFQGIASFEYNPSDLKDKQMFLFGGSPGLDLLKDDLLKKFEGKKLSMQKIYEEHTVDTPYIKKNYKEILRQLYDDGTIQAISSKGKPPKKGTFGKDTIVTFPN